MNDDAPKQVGKTDRKTAERRRRQAEQLRANLKKRKQQSRTRDSS